MLSIFNKSRGKSRVEIVKSSKVTKSRQIQSPLLQIISKKDINVRLPWFAKFYEFMVLTASKRKTEGATS